MASSGAEVGADNFSNLAPVQESKTIKLSRLHQPWLKRKTDLLVVFLQLRSFYCAGLNKITKIFEINVFMLFSKRKNFQFVKN